MGVDKLRTLAGRATCISSLLHVWRPFVSMLWGPIYNTRSRCPFDPLKVWRTAVDVPLRWMNAFLIGAAGSLSRIYRLSSYLQEGDRVTIVTDASPLGIGAFLIINGIIKEYAFGPLTKRDEDILRVKRGGSEGQQAWEGLAILAALRLWSWVWRDRRISLAVRSDSVSALVMLVKMKADGFGVGIISREIALDVAESLYEPNICSHIPGTTNIIADTLSRMPGVDCSSSSTSTSGSSFTPLPSSLRQSQQRFFQERGYSWWRAL